MRTTRTSGKRATARASRSPIAKTPPFVTVAVNEGQNGLLLTRCEGAKAFDNEFSFNSGWGIALYRSNRCVVAHNRCDWCVRGYSHGVYHRGQDSAGILVFEQSSHNVFVGNSATHGGDGFFLYAGHETTQRTGLGGCNDNLVFDNDFSHAVANGIEATFSKGNLFVRNHCADADHGIWAGYSADSLFASNDMHACKTAGISIEHGQNNRIHPQPDHGLSGRRAPLVGSGQSVRRRGLRQAAQHRLGKQRAAWQRHLGRGHVHTTRWGPRHQAPMERIFGHGCHPAPRGEGRPWPKSATTTSAAPHAQADRSLHRRQRDWKRVDTAHGEPAPRVHARRRPARPRPAGAEPGLRAPQAACACDPLHARDKGHGAERAHAPRARGDPHRTLGTPRSAAAARLPA